jgi:hypothetical protein
VPYIPGEIGVEDRVDRPGARHAAFDRKSEMIDDGRSRTVCADHVFRPDGELPTIQSIAQRGRDACGILLVTDVFGVESERRTLLGRLPKQDRFEQRLDDVHHPARTCPQIVAPAVVPRTPRPHPDQFGPGETGRERRVAHQFPRARVPCDVLRDSEIPEDLVRSLVRDVRARTVGHPVAARYDVTAHAGIRECQRGRRAGRSGSDDQYVAFVGHGLLRDASEFARDETINERRRSVSQRPSPCRRASRGWLRRIPAPW